MRRVFLCVFWLLTGLSSPALPAITLQPYQRGDWATLMQAHQGRPWIVHFWGVTCGPCLVELPQWGAFMRRHPDAPVVFVQADQTPQQATQRILTQAGLENATHRVASVPFDEFVRYEIDPKWMGELPTTYLIDKNGRRVHLQGSVQFEQIDRWLARQSGSH